MYCTYISIFVCVYCTKKENLREVAWILTFNFIKMMPKSPKFREKSLYFFRYRNLWCFYMHYNLVSTLDLIKKFLSINKYIFSVFSVSFAFYVLRFQSSKKKKNFEITLTTWGKLYWFAWLICEIHFCCCIFWGLIF